MAFLPIYQIEDDIIEVLKNQNRLILQAPTGSGKSTQIPQILADKVLPQDKKIVILQPRRIATRLLAGYIASERNSILGDETGYRVRLEGQWSENTRILFYTEGILLQKLLNQDALVDIGSIIFDEFHERHIETDICLALSRELQIKTRPDLKIIVMSATLDTNKVRKYLDNCPVLKTEGRTFPVDIRYFQPKPYETIWDCAAIQLESNINLFINGAALVFMPGSYEIKKTIEAISKRSKLSEFSVLPLYGGLSKEEQDKAVCPGKRKIIVSTNVAETSLTIPDITLVIDSGLAKISRFDMRRGVNTLFTEPVSKSSAQQRAGRAGRTTSGHCIRLWSEFSHQNRAENDTPEIHRIDLSEIILGLLNAGFTDITRFPWFDTPDFQNILIPLQLLTNLGAIDSKHILTDTGHKMADFNMHPRFSRMLVEAKKNNCFSTACIIAALVQSSGIFYPTSDESIKNERIHLFGNTFSDLTFELNAWIWAGNHNFKTSECRLLGINSAVARQVAQLALQIIAKNHSAKQKLPNHISSDEELNLRKSIFTGFLDLLAIKHNHNSATCQMMSGKSGQLHRNSIVKNAKILVVNELEEIKTPVGIQLFLKKATEIEESWLENYIIDDIQNQTTLRFDSKMQKVIKVSERSWNGLILKREVAECDDPEESSVIFARAILEGKIEFTPWNEEVIQFVRRINFAATNCSEYGIPFIDEHAKEFIIQQAVYHCKNVKEIQRCDVWSVLKGWLNVEQQSSVDYLAPETIELPHKRKPVKLRYDEKGDVILSETIQALFDCPLPITVANGKVPVIFELLAPSRRPVQITKDLDYFWKNSYHEIKKELKGRYPKHEWR